MANPEHLALLKRGLKAWNEWRENTPALEVDLSEADLSRANLDDANLIKTNLSKANLREASLKGSMCSSSR